MAQTKRPEEKSAGWWARLLCTIVFAVLIVGSIIANISANAEASARRAAAQQRIDAANVEIADIETALEKSDQQLAVVFSSAESAGAAVAEIQNKYKELPEIDTSDETAYEAFKKSVEDIASEMDAYLEPAAANARVPWFNFSGTWRFMSTYSFDGSSIPVVWICEENGHVLAITTAKYDTETKAFSKFKRNYTADGVAEIDATSADTPAYAESVLSVVEQLQEKYPELAEPKELTEEEQAGLAAAGEARQALRDEHLAGNDGRVEEGSDTADAADAATEQSAESTEGEQ